MKIMPYELFAAHSFQAFGGGVMPSAWRHETSQNHRANKTAKKARKAQRKARRANRAVR